MCGSIAIDRRLIYPPRGVPWTCLFGRNTTDSETLLWLLETLGACVVVNVKFFFEFNTGRLVFMRG